MTQAESDAIKKRQTELYDDARMATDKAMDELQEAVAAFVGDHPTQCACSLCVALSASHDAMDAEWEVCKTSYSKAYAEIMG